MAKNSIDQSAETKQIRADTQGLTLKLGSLFSVEGKVVLVTGGQRGIGFMIAKALVANGAKVYISSRNRTGDCDEAAALLNSMGPGQCISLPADISSDKDCVDLAKRLGEKEDKLHALFNNAGVTWGDKFEKFPEEAWTKIMNLNVIQIFNLTRACMPLLEKASQGAYDPAKVIITGSAGGDTNAIGATNYSYLTSKAAVQHLSRQLAAEMAPKALVTVNCIQPGIFPSKMSDDFFLRTEQTRKVYTAGIPVGRIGAQEDMGGLALYLTSKASAYLTGQTISLDGGGTGMVIPTDINWREVVMKSKSKL